MAVRDDLTCPREMAMRGMMRRAGGALAALAMEQNVQLRGGETLYWNLRKHLLVQEDP